MSHSLAGSTAPSPSAPKIEFNAQASSVPQQQQQQHDCVAAERGKARLLQTLLSVRNAIARKSADLFKVNIADAIHKQQERMRWQLLEKPQQQQPPPHLDTLNDLMSTILKVSTEARCPKVTRKFTAAQFYH